MGVDAALLNLNADTSTLTRALYSSDASLYRVVPAGVAHPRTTEELDELVTGALSSDVPITIRGAGTSCAGNAIGPGLVLDTSRHLTSIVELDPLLRTATVQPGVVQARLSAAGSVHGLRFGPDPSTSDRCTVGGMIGNNACGPRALGYGRTSDQVFGLDVITGTGERLTLDRTTDLRGLESPVLSALRQLVQRNLGVIRTEFGRFPRQLSGYAVEHLLPENGFDVTRFLVGSEGTLGVVTSARVSLTRDQPLRRLVILGYPTMADAADAMPAVLAARPVACEGLDERIIATVRNRQGAASVPELPGGTSWLFVELAGDQAAELAERAAALVRSSGCLEGRVLADAAEVAGWWRIRSDGAGFAALALDKPAHAGWEDAAVPPARLGDYLRDFEALLSSHGLHGLPYGHFGDGCVHCRIDFPLDRPGGTAAFRRFLDEAAALAGSYGGTMTGEHGDGRARSGLLPAMYSPAALQLFAQIKAIFDPKNLLNPGVIVDPRPPEVDLRIAELGRPLTGFEAEVHRCTGVGRCVSTLGSATMCPSYRATGREQDSTRGRARVLQEMVRGTLITGGPAAPEVREALDLCLGCKACSSECPTGVDLASYKAQVLDQELRGRLRPLSHYTLGRLPSWLALIGRIPGAAAVLNASLTNRWLSRVSTRLAGLDPRRSLPRIAARPNRRFVYPDPDPSVVLWVDCNTDGVAGDQLAAAVRVLEAAGQRLGVVGPEACCGLTYTSTGQLDAARRRLRRSVKLLGPSAEAGLPIIGLEPSCLAVWGSDAAWLLPDEPLVPLIASRVTTLAAFLTTLPDWEPPDLTGVTVIAQPHCHQRVVLDWNAERALLASAGATVTVVDGCCGMAGGFGMEAEHYDVSVAVANLALLPELQRAGRDAVVLADGLSCRAQIEDLSDRRPVALAELLVAAAARQVTN